MLTRNHKRCFLAPCLTSLKTKSMRRTNVLGTIVAVIAIAVSDPGTVLAQPIKWTTKAVTPVMGGTGRRSAMSFISGSKV